jgi:2-oxoacid:acceptor oxidoreductase gamma subunit (pyruvate/2-ketoisovalerate family)
MFELRFHGRGGQGAVTSAELLALAAIAGGKFAQAFPSFGPERRGAPVIAYARIDGKQIRNRTAVSKPDAVLVLDPSLLSIVNTSDGIADGGFQVVNSAKPIPELREQYGLAGKLAVVNANHIAIEEIGRAITNTTMLGALVKATGVVERELNRAFEECVLEG